MTYMNRSPADPGPGPHPDHRMEEVIGRLLQLGVLAAAAVVMLGGVAFLLHHGMAVADFREFRVEPTALRSVQGIIQGAIALDSRAVLQFGLVLLIATPVARVALTLVAFLASRDYLYVGMSAVVLALLLFSLFAG